MRAGERRVVLDLDAGTELPWPEKGWDDDAVDVSMSDRHLFAWREDGKGALFELPSMRVVEHRDFGHAVRVALAPDGASYVVFDPATNELQIYAQERQIGKARATPDTAFDSITYADDGSVFFLDVSRMNDVRRRHVEERDAKSGKLVRTHRGLVKVYAASASPSRHVGLSTHGDDDVALAFARGERTVTVPLEDAPWDALLRGDDVVVARSLSMELWSGDGKLLRTWPHGATMVRPTRTAGEILEHDSLHVLRRRRPNGDVVELLRGEGRSTVLVSPSGRTLLELGQAVRLFDTTTGALLGGVYTPNDGAQAWFFGEDVVVAASDGEAVLRRRDDAIDVVGYRPGASDAPYPVAPGVTVDWRDRDPKTGIRPVTFHVAGKPARTLQIRADARDARAEICGARLPRFVQRPSGARGRVDVTDATTRQTIKSFPEAGWTARPPPLSPDGRLVAVAWKTDDKPTVKLYSVDDGRVLQVIEGTAEPLTFTPDGRALVVKDFVGPLRIVRIDGVQAP
ncbi:Hypothetical protein A7982_08180 [Minicystis rosea]|nr:Hypothetical protein A7982_08180 [Minicystis rosea]